MQPIEQQEGHVPQYPKYVEKTFTTRTLAYYDAEQHTIVDEKGNVYTLDDRLSTCVDILYSYNLLLFLDSLLMFPHIDELIQHDKHIVLADGKGHPIAAQLKCPRNATRWIVQADAWGALAGPGLLKTLRVVYKLCGVGTPGTPGGLGQALMRKSWAAQYGDNWEGHKHSRPSLPCCHDILSNMTGGRVDTPGLGQYYEVLSELDQKSAYPAHYSVHPTGAAIRTWGVAPLWAVTYFVHCIVTVEHDLLLGPFPYRVKQGNLKYPIYPTSPGAYECWLWKEQIEDCKQLGCSVEVLDGWAWEKWTRDNAAWVMLVEYLRARAARTHTPHVEDCIKLCMVAAVGRHGMKEYSYQLVGSEQAGELDTQVSDNDTPGLGKIYNWFIHEVYDANYNGMPHWFSYTIMQCARTLYWKAYQWKEKEVEEQTQYLAATNYDAIYIKGEVSGMAVKGTQQEKDLRIGDWRVSYLHNATIPHPRHVVSDEKVKQPGVQKRNRRKSK